MVKSFRVFLSHPNALYIAPSEVVGSVVLCNRYRYISVSLTGRAVASWSTHDGIRNMHLNNSSEYYVIQSISLWDNEDDSTADHQLPPGEHTFLSASR